VPPSSTAHARLEPAETAAANPELEVLMRTVNSRVRQHFEPATYTAASAQECRV
jgi:hypothetical protein